MQHAKQVKQVKQVNRSKVALKVSRTDSQAILFESLLPLPVIMVVGAQAADGMMFYYRDNLFRSGFCF